MSKETRTLKYLHSMLEGAKQRDNDYKTSLQTYEKALSKSEELRELINENCGYPLDDSLVTVILELLDVVESHFDSAREWLHGDIEHNDEYIKSIENDIKEEEEKA